MRMAALLGVLVATLFATNAARASQCAILLDISASMRGFKSPQSTFPSFLEDLIGICPDGYVFGDPHPADRALTAREVSRSQIRARYPYLDFVTGLGSWPFDDGTTHLAGAIESWSENISGSDGVAIVVTDNVADADDLATGGEQDRFSSDITQSNIGDLAVVAARFRFDGNVYDPHNKPTPYHRGRAIAIYVVEKTGKGTFGNYLEKVKDLTAKHALAYEQIQIRPLIESAAPTAALVGFETDNKTVFAEMKKSTDGRLKAHFRNHHMDQALTLSFPIEFRSPKVWRVTAHPQANLTFVTPKSDLSDDLQPVTVNARLVPDGPITIEPGQAVIRVVRVPISGIDYKATARLGPILEQLLNGAGAKGTGRLTVRMNYTDFELSRDVVKDWDYSGSPDMLGADDPAVQGKIFRLADIAKQIVRKAAPTEPPITIDITSESEPPMWPLYAFLIFAILALAGIAFLIFVLGKRRDYEITNDVGEKRKVGLTFGAAAIISSGNGGARARARRFVMFMYVSSTQSVVMGRVLWGDGGGTILLRRGGRSRSPFEGLAGFFAYFRRPQRRRGEDDAEPRPVIEKNMAETYRFRIAGLTHSPGGYRRRQEDDIL